MTTLGFDRTRRVDSRASRLVRDQKGELRAPDLDVINEIKLLA